MLQIVRVLGLLTMATALTPALAAPAGPAAKIVSTGGTGWAQTSVNVPIFRTNSLATYGDTQYIAFYDGDGTVVLGKRQLGTEKWELKRTSYKGRVQDGHNAISIILDGDSFLHMVWDLHGQKLRYARSVAPGSLDLTEELPMTGDRETKVTYPQFYNLPNGDLLFLYRDGSSGDGDAMLNRYDVANHKWSVVQHPLIDGEGKRNAYINRMAVDDKGGWHLSWCWRESPDVASNHDVCYAYSPDEGKTWQTSTGTKYNLPITAATAEVAWPVPQKSELINQTSMAVDAQGRPIIVTYWRPEGTEVPQFQLVWHDGKQWRLSQVGQRTQAFRLSGGGTKRIPISRPQVVAGPNNFIYVIFRDEERGGGVTLASSNDPDHTKWNFEQLYQPNLGAWEPTYDSLVWKRDQQLHLFLETVGQGDGEKLENIPPQPVSVLEWTPPVKAAAPAARTTRH